MKGILLAILLLSGCDSSSKVCTPNIEKNLERAGYKDKIRRQANKACANDTNLYVCQQKMQEAKAVEACFIELTR
jgi:hypothetical protein